MNPDKPQKSGVSLIEITAAEQGQRLDNYLFKQFDGVPRTRVYRGIRKGEVRVNKKRCKPEYKLQAGDRVRIPPLRQSESRPVRKPSAAIIDRIAAAIIHETEHIMVLNKPSGIAVHAGSGVDFGVIDILRELRPGEPIELVHRLDRDTSGCLLLARHRPALLTLQACLQDHSLVKRYCAVVEGLWPAHVLEMSFPLKKIHLPNGERRMKVDASGKPALTRVSVVRSGERFSSIQLELVTGRTHQIRVHCQAQGHAIAGDDKYGNDEFNRLMRRKKIKRLMLHAASLEFPDSDYTQEVVINADLPEEFECFT